MAYSSVEKAKDQFFLSPTMIKPEVIYINALLKSVSTFSFLWKTDNNSGLKIVGKRQGERERFDKPIGNFSKY